jgi:hypothetical protein
MSRSGYYDDCDDWLAHGRWRARVASATRGKRGQKFLRDLLAALDAMPVKRLITEHLSTDGNETMDTVFGVNFEYCPVGVIVGADELIDPGSENPVTVGEVCAIGALGKARGIDMSKVNPENTEKVGLLFDIADPLVREIVYHNDECGEGRRVPIPNVLQSRGDYFGWQLIPETPEERWVRMRKWVAAQIWDWKEIEETPA